MLPDLNNIRPGAEYVSVKEAAIRAKLTPRTIYLWIRSGKIAAYGHGHGTRVLMGDVLAPRIPKAPKRKRARRVKATAEPAAEIRLDNVKDAAPPPGQIPPTDRSLVGLTIPERIDTRPFPPSIGHDNGD